MADSVFVGKIITMDDKNTVEEAVAVKDGKIMFVGSSEDVKKYVGVYTLVHDYGDSVIYPGFIDDHTKKVIIIMVISNGIMIEKKNLLKL